MHFIFYFKLIRPCLLIVNQEKFELKQSFRFFDFLGATNFELCFRNSSKSLLAEIQTIQNNFILFR